MSKKETKSFLITFILLSIGLFVVFYGLEREYNKFISEREKINGIFLNLENRVDYIEDKFIGDLLENSANFAEARIQIMLLEKEGYSWEWEGIRYTTKAESACISTSDKWVTTSVPEEYKNLSDC